MLIKTQCLFDGVTDQPYQGYVITKNEKIIKVSEGITSEQEEIKNGEVIDLGNKTVMAGFCDNHVHIFLAALDMATCNVGYIESEELAAEKLYDFYKNRDDEWVIGFGWSHYDWPEQKLPTKESLDKYFPDRPAMIINDELHALWVNSRALEICGVDKDTADPPNSMIMRDEYGNPSGYILEQAAMKLFTDKALAYSSDAEKKLIEDFIHHAQLKGVTSVGDMEILDILKNDVYEKLEDSGQLKLRVFFSPSINKPLEEFLEIRRKFNSDNLSLLGAKGFIDGTPLGHTGLMLEDYSDMPGVNGEPVIDLRELREKVLLLNKHRIPVRLHACGDGAVREALDDFADANNKYDAFAVRNTIEHIECIDKSDVDRFVATGTVASIQPNHMTMDSMNEHPACRILGEKRIKLAWPAKTISDTGTCVSLGTDCPIVPLEPIETLYRAVNRVMEDGTPEGGWNAKEKYSLSEAIKGVTINSAYLYGMEDKIGTVEAGKYADIIALTENIFEQDPLKLMNTDVEMTIWNGEVVYKRSTLHRE